MTIFDYDRKRAIKQTGFTKCVCCDKGVAHSGAPIFYRITLEMFGIDGQAVRRQTGLEQVLGGHARLAQVMGPDDDIGIPVGDAMVGLVCQQCMCSPDTILAIVLGQLTRAAESRKAERA